MRSTKFRNSVTPSFPLSYVGSNAASWYVDNALRLEFYQHVAFPVYEVVLYRPLSQLSSINRKPIFTSQWHRARIRVTSRTKCTLVPCDGQNYQDFGKVTRNFCFSGGKIIQKWLRWHGMTFNPVKNSMGFEINRKNINEKWGNFERTRIIRTV